MSRELSIEERTDRTHTMANELTWQQLEELFDGNLAGLSDEERRDLKTWLNENEEPPNWFDQPEDFIRQRDGVHGWLHSYKKEMNVPEAHQDLRSFHRRMRTDVLRILENESGILGPFKFKLEVVVNLHLLIGKAQVYRQFSALVFISSRACKSQACWQFSYHEAVLER